MFDAFLHAVTFGVTKDSVPYPELASDLSRGGTDVQHYSLLGKALQWTGWNNQTNHSQAGDYWVDGMPGAVIGIRSALISLGSIDNIDVMAVVSPLHGHEYVLKNQALHCIEEKTGDNKATIPAFSLDLQRFAADKDNHRHIWSISGPTSAEAFLELSVKPGTFARHADLTSSMTTVSRVGIGKLGVDSAIIDNQFNISRLSDVSKNFDEIADSLTKIFEIFRGYMTCNVRLPALTP